jgi:hypothetical protein
MFTRTINHAVTTSLDELGSRAEPILEEMRRDANQRADEFTAGVLERLEFGIYVTAGAIVAGALLVALLNRLD